MYSRCYREEKPTLKAILNGHRFEAHVYMERIPIEQVPENEKECEKWMLDVFEKKVIVLTALLFNVLICLNKLKISQQ